MPHVVRLPLSQSVDLRQRVLRPGQAEVTVTADDDLSAVQMAALDDHGTPVACANTRPADVPWQAADRPSGAPEGLAWRLRGVATDDAHRRQGLAQACVVACDDVARDAGAVLVWCNARLSADAFYEQLGWQPWGEVFGIGVIGPHVVRWKAL